ncbi:MAG: succinate dehydrogenase assembly factor 2 [Rhodospirillaceae bacterium]|nr:succinate dehydrogenase assembly factor 2 [Rhodospirillaceae bacterium]
MIDNRRKRILFRSSHCGMKENDILLGGFASACIGELNDAELDAFEVLMEQSDIDVLKWVTGKAPVPGAFDGPLMQHIKKFNKTG